VRSPKILFDHVVRYLSDRQAYSGIRGENFVTCLIILYQPFFEGAIVGVCGLVIYIVLIRGIGDKVKLPRGFDLQPMNGIK
jgi:hypothetical protein